MSSTDWRSFVDVSKIDAESRRRILDYVVVKRGKEYVQQYLEISRVTMWRLLSGKVDIDDDKLRKLLYLIDLHEFEKLVGAVGRLRALGILRDDGSVDYGLALEILALASRDEYLKQAILRFVVDNFREDLRKMLNVSLARVEFRWTEDFERYLREHKKGKKVSTDETIQYYRNLFKEYLEGKVLSEELVEWVSRHPNGWLRNVFRHYVRYFFRYRKIPGEVYGWIMEVVPSRSWKGDVQYRTIPIEDVIRTLQFLKEHHSKYYAFYRLLLESGIRELHAIEMIHSFAPEEEVYVKRGRFYSKRLVCFEEKGFCRYFVGIDRPRKVCEWVWFSIETLELVKELVEYLKEKGKKLRRQIVRKYASIHNLLRPEAMRKVNWRIVSEVVSDSSVRLFMHSRFGELKLRVGDARYGDLLSKADGWYSRVLEYIRRYVYERIGSG